MRCDGPGLATTRRAARDLEVVARVGDRLLFFWRESTPPLAWHGPFPVVAEGRAVVGVAGNPVLIQSKFGQKGNFELVVPLAGGGLAAETASKCADTSMRTGPCQGRFASSLSRQYALIQSNFGVPGNLEVISRMAHASRTRSPVGPADRRVFRP